jgi:hypothetical protein
MRDVAIGALAVAGGALFCFRGFIGMRLVFAVWGAFAGFMTGAGLVAAIGGDGILTTATGWVVGLVFAVVTAALAYLFFAISVLLAMSSLGYLLGTTLMIALGVRWSWLIVLAGIAVGVLLTLAAIRLDLPGAVIIVLTATGGAAAITGGLMLAVGTLDAGDLTTASVTERLHDHPTWWFLYVGLAIAGIVAQVRVRAALTTSAREAWREGS